MSILKWEALDAISSHQTLIVFDLRDLPSDLISVNERLFLSKQLEEKGAHAELIQPNRSIFLLPNLTDKAFSNELYRRKGVVLLNRLKSLACSEVGIVSSKNFSSALALAEGIVLANYQFSKYKKITSTSLSSISICADKEVQANIASLSTILDAVYISRDLVNEPVIFLTAEQLSSEIETLGMEVGFSTEILTKNKIKSLKMGGLLAVNEGSPNPPTFTVLEYRPKQPKNSAPIVLVGKGVVYDTGGLSLKPTENSMDMMKCDMAGAAAVIGLFYAAAKNNLPIHLVGLIPATENRPSGNAITPGDIITMHSGKTVEVLNTDAEGRLILADALSYAKKYNPSLVIDLATLTGSAVRAIGKEGIVFMGNADESIKKELIEAGFDSFERLVEFPLWDDYNHHIQSDIADLKNIGTSEAGAISAGKFLEHFTDYPWLHLDIAGGAFMTAPFHYWVKGGTGIGVRLLYRFLEIFKTA